MKAAEVTFGDFWMLVFVFVFLSGLVLIFLVQRYICISIWTCTNISSAAV